MSRQDSPPFVAIIVGVLVVLAGGIGGCVAWTKLEKIPPGYVGVSVKKCGDSKVSREPIPTGYYWRELFCEEVVRYPVSMQSLVLDAAPPRDEAIIVTSSEGLNISLDVAMNYTLEATKVPEIYEKWRADIDDISHKYIRQTIREALQLTFAKYTAEELYSTKKEIARMEAEKHLTAHLKPLGFVISQFTINRIEPPKQVIEAINQKVAMVQQAQRAEQEVKKKEFEAAQAIAVAKGQASAAMAAAEGEARAITLKAEAQAKANKILAESVTSPLIEYEKMRKWDGHLPQFSGVNSTPMIQVK